MGFAKQVWQNLYKVWRSQNQMTSLLQTKLGKQRSRCCLYVMQPPSMLMGLGLKGGEIVGGWVTRSCRTISLRLDTISREEYEPVGEWVVK